MKTRGKLSHIFQRAAVAGVVIAPFTAQAAGVAAATSAVGAQAMVGPLAFASPLLLLGLGALPVLWWLMRSVPPKPKSVSFPAIKMLFNLQSQDQEPARMPLWHRIMRLTAAGMAIVGFAQPLIKPEVPLKGEGPVVVVVDNDWASARQWPERQAEIKNLMARAEKAGRQIVIVPTASDGTLGKADLEKGALQPEPWPADYSRTLETLNKLKLEKKPDIIWLSDGLQNPGAETLANRLQKLGPLTVLHDKPQAGAHLLALPEESMGPLTICVRRPDGAIADKVILTARDENGRTVSRTEAVFKPGQKETQARFTSLSDEAKSQVIRVVIEGEDTAGATLLLDERWRRRPVGVIAARVSGSSDSLLSDSRYVEQALAPYAEMRQGAVDKLLSKKLAVLVQTDDAIVSDKDRQQIEQWVRDGGTLLRFAGPHLVAASNTDSLLPVHLRPGTRLLKESKAEGHQSRLEPFDAGSLFAGLSQNGEVIVNQEVVAQPDADGELHVWARLDDGTPLITAAHRDKGWIVLVHTTANAEWSNLPLSGTFVGMLRGIVAHSQGVTGADDAALSLPPLKLLDGQGRFATPGSEVKPLTQKVIHEGLVNAANPPGFYGNESGQEAHNLASAISQMKPLAALPSDVKSGPYTASKHGIDLTGPLLAGALALILADLAVVMGQRGLLSRPRRKQAAPQPAAPS